MLSACNRRGERALETFLSSSHHRFDLIFLMLDPQDEAYDRRLGKHLVSLYHQTREEEQEEELVSVTRGGGGRWRQPYPFKA